MATAQEQIIDDSFSAYIDIMIEHEIACVKHTLSWEKQICEIEDKWNVIVVVMMNFQIIHIALNDPLRFQDFGYLRAIVNSVFDVLRNQIGDYNVEYCNINTALPIKDL